MPRCTATASASWLAREKLAFTLRLSFPGRHFSDLENTLQLDDAIAADMGMWYALSPQSELFLTAENCTNTRVETFRNPNGVTYVGSPRMMFGGIRQKW